jgi:hypothetical protein
MLPSPFARFFAMSVPPSFGSTNNYHRSGTKSTDFFGRSEYF